MTWGIKSNPNSLGMIVGIKESKTKKMKKSTGECFGESTHEEVQSSVQAFLDSGGVIKHEQDGRCQNSIEFNISKYEILEEYEEYDSSTPFFLKKETKK